MTIKRVLVVDDSPTERQFLTDLLSKQNFEVLTASSGEEALQRAKDIKPDLILMDVVMPGINGFQATRALSKDDLTRHIPVIMCTSKDTETDKIWGLRQGAKEYLTKPINQAELLQKIASLG